MLSFSCIRLVPGHVLVAVALAGLLALFSAPAGPGAAAQTPHPATPGFDTSALPWPPTTFEEQLLWDDVQSAISSPALAARAHTKLAGYYERKGLPALASKESAAAGDRAAAAPAQSAGPTAPSPAPADGSPAAAPADGTGPAAAMSGSGVRLVNAARGEVADSTDPLVFETTGLPAQPATFEEQRIMDTLDDPNTATNPALLAFAHRQLGRYYAAAGRVELAGAEFGRALLADPADYRSYTGLAALSEAAGAPAGDGRIDLRETAAALQAQAAPPDAEAEPEPVVVAPADPGQWQEVSASFNRRMNSLYTSNAWSNVYRTVFTNLYGR